MPAKNIDAVSAMRKSRPGWRMVVKAIVAAVAASARRTDGGAKSRMRAAARPAIRGMTSHNKGARWPRLRLDMQRCSNG